MSARRIVALHERAQARTPRCICTDVLPEGSAARPCPHHGWMGEQLADVEIERQS